MALVFVTVFLLASCGDDAPSVSATETPGRVVGGPTDSEPAPAPTTVPSGEPVAVPSAWSSAVAVSPTGAVAMAVNPDSRSVTLVDAARLEVIAEIEVGIDPRTVAFDPSGTTAFVANRGSGTVTRVDVASGVADTEWRVGAAPYGVIVSEDAVYVSHLTEDSVTVLDPETGDVLNRVEMGAFPAGLALTGGVKPWLLVTHLFSAELTAIDVATREIAWVVSSGVGANLSQSVVVTPDGKTAYMPQTRSRSDNPALVFDNTVMPIVSAVDLENAAVSRTGRITLDTADRPVNMPFGAAFGRGGRTLFVANAGSNDVSVIDLETGRGTAHVQVGSNPRGIASAQDGSRIFVNNVLDGTLSVIDARSMRVERTIVLTQLDLPEPILEGKRIFNSSSEPALSRDQWVSCASCHFDGMHDGRTWSGFPDGTRNTPSLLGVRDTLPTHWSGNRDELQDSEVTIRMIQGGRGLVDGEAFDPLGPPHAGLSERLDALAAYLTTLEPWYAIRTDEGAAAAERGALIFERLGCAVCHPGPLYTDVSLHDVGTGDAASGPGGQERRMSWFDTPSLRGVRLTAPYFHDGRAPTLWAALAGEAGEHAVAETALEAEMAALIAFLRSL